MGIVSSYPGAFGRASLKLKMRWVLMVSYKDEYKFHSIHKNEATVLEWRKCKECDGEDTKILTLTLEDVADILEAIS